MRNQTTRIALLLPLLWALSLGAAGAAPAKKKKGKKPPSVAVEADYTGVPVAKLGTPDKSVEVFRLTAGEKPEWSYMVVTNDEDGSRRAYGDEQTVGRVLESLTSQVRTNGGSHGRCPAASGWRFENAVVRASYCSETVDAQRISRAVELLEISPEE